MSKKKNILIISTSDINDSAGVVVYDLFKALINSEFNPQLLIRYTECKENGIFSYYNKIGVTLQKGKNRLLQYFFKVKTNPDFGFVDFNLIKNKIRIEKIKKKGIKPDFIIAFFMQNFFTFKDLFIFQKKFNAPVLLLMVDRVYLTGGCHYMWNCNGFKNNCTNCPAILDNKKKKQVIENFKFNMYFVNNMNIELVTFSKQDYLLAKESKIWKTKKINKVLLGINLSIFYKKNNIFEKRNLFGISKKDFVIFYGATSLSKKRKGVKYFLEALKSLREKINNENDNVTIIIAGKGDIEETIRQIGFNVISVGFVKSYSKLADLYNLADVFVNTSIQDSGPMMINQSIACGTPVVSFNIGVAQDIIINGKTGFKTEIYNSDGIADSICKILKMDKESYLIMQNNCIHMAKEKFSKEKFTENILNIIKNQ